MLLSWPLYPCSQDLICPVHIISSPLLIFCVLLIKFHKSSDENHELNNGSRQKPILPAPGVKKLINSNYIIFWPRKILYKFHSVRSKSECGESLVWFRLYRKGNYDEEDDDPHPVCESQSQRSSAESWRMFLADWIHSPSVRRGRNV